MASDVPFSNAIAWGHIQLRGGWKNLLLTTLGYALLVGVVIIVTIRMSPKYTTSILGSWTMVLLAIQVGILILFGCGTVSAALRTDLSSRIIESHRLMPVSPVAAIIGYLLGAASQVLCMAFATLLIGFLTNWGSTAPSDRWLIPNLILGLFALFAWIVVLYAGFVTRQGARWLLVMVVILMASRGIVMALCPALSVLASPLIGQTIFERRNWGSMINWEYSAAILSQFVIGTIFFIGAARKYKRDDAMAMPTPLGLLLLAAWVVISIVGIEHWDGFRSQMWGPAPFDQRTQFLSTLAASMLLALVPVAAASRADAQWRQHCHFAGNTQRRPIPSLLAVLLAAGVVLGLLWVDPDADAQRRERAFRGIRAAVAVVAFLLSTSYVLRIMHTLGSKVLLVVGSWVILLWVGPFLIDTVRHGASTDLEDEVLSLISTCSPLGTLIQLWERKPLDTTLGLVVQSVLAGIMGLVFYSVFSRRSGQGGEPGFPVVLPAAAKS